MLSRSLTWLTLAVLVFYLRNACHCSCTAYTTRYHSVCTWYARTNRSYSALFVPYVRGWSPMRAEPNWNFYFSSYFNLSKSLKMLIALWVISGLECNGEVQVLVVDNSLFTWRPSSKSVLLDGDRREERKEDRERKRKKERNRERERERERNRERERRKEWERVCEFTASIIIFHFFNRILTGHHNNPMTSCHIIWIQEIWISVKFYAQWRSCLTGKPSC